MPLSDDLFFSRNTHSFTLTNTADKRFKPKVTHYYESRHFIGTSQGKMNDEGFSLLNQQSSIIHSYCTMHSHCMITDIIYYRNDNYTQTESMLLHA